jgi:hypothetical protein
VKQDPRIENGSRPRSGARPLTLGTTDEVEYLLAAFSIAAHGEVDLVGGAQQAAELGF